MNDGKKLDFKKLDEIQIENMIAWVKSHVNATKIMLEPSYEPAPLLNAFLLTSCVSEEKEIAATECVKNLYGDDRNSFNQFFMQQIVDCFLI